MKIAYLGTAAAEGFPAVFCNCEFCREARKQGGKNIRTRSQALINDDLLIDLPADTYHHFLQNGIEGDKIQHLLVTHAHSDHFYPKELGMHHGYFAHDLRAPVLTVFGGEGVENEFAGTPEISPNVSFCRLKPFDVVKIGNYTVHALPARHMPGGDPLIYIIQADKTILYAHDTGYFYEEVFKYIQEKGFRFDLVSLDCTNCDLPISDEGHHMGFPNIERVLTRLAGMNAISDSTLRIVNHFSHNANPIHARLEQRAASLGCIPAYDGMSITIA